MASFGRRIVAVLFVLASRSGAAALSVPPLSSSQRLTTIRSSSNTVLFSSGQGFGKTTTPPKKASPSSAASESSSAEAVDAADSAAKQMSAAVAASTPNAGQRALAELRRQEAERKALEQQRMASLQAADDQVRETAPVIPEVVANRMGQRMLAFVGIPLGLGGVAFAGFAYLTTVQNYEIPTGLVALVTLATLGVALLGITYSMFSTSWDEEPEGKDGDWLGWQEAQRNVGNVKDGLERSKQNAILRDQMQQRNNNNSGGR